MSETNKSVVRAAGHGGLARALRLIIRGYQFVLAPWLGARCRFHPSCSHYALEALAEHGAARGVWLSALRLGRCHPFNEGGFDPVPPTSGSASGVQQG